MAAGHVPWNAVINLGNSIIGVSILAMPWCFKECGLALGILLLLCGGFLTKATCYLLLRASKVSRKHSYEFLAQHALGALGKMVVELCIIGLLMCTCIAFFVIIGDLAPSIVSKWLGLQNSWHLRCCLLMLVACFIVLPLGMKRNVESLGSLSMMSITFYLLFTADILWDSLPNLLSMKWMDDIELWRLPGVLKGISIFSMSLCCQTTLFVVYDSLQEKTVKQMEAVVSKSVNMVTGIYILVGFFGYVCYYQGGIKGDILLNFTPSLLSEVLRLGFTVSVALSFPLCIFPCRASIYTLFCHSTLSVENPHGGGDFIPPAKFKLITLMIVSSTLVVGITIPNVETILGLTGATMGSMIGFIIPAIIYLRTNGVPNKTNAKIILVIGMLLLVCSTYDNLQAAPVPAADAIVDEGLKVPNNLLPVMPDQLPVDKNVVVEVDAGDDVIKDGKKEGAEKADEKQKAGLEAGQGADRMEMEEVKKDLAVGNEKRQEPPIPHAPDSKEDAAEVKKALEGDGDEKENEQEVKKDVMPLVVEEERARDDDKEVGADDLMKGDEKEIKVLEEVNMKQKALEQKEKELKDKEENLDKVVEEKLAEQDQKQEKQMKKLVELEIRQHEQEKLIEAQAEVIEDLKVQHKQELPADMMDMLEVADGGADPLLLQQQQQQQPAVGIPQQVLVPQAGLQQQQQQQQQVPIVPQNQDMLPMGGGPAQPIIQQEPAVGQQGLAGQPALQPAGAGQPLVQQVGQQGVLLPVNQGGMMGAPDPGLGGLGGAPQNGLAGVVQGDLGAPQADLRAPQADLGGAPLGGLAGVPLDGQGLPQGNIGVAPQVNAALQPDDQMQGNEGHIVRREAPLQQQMLNVAPEQQQLLMQQQLPLQQQQQIVLQPQLSNQLPQQQQFDPQRLQVAGGQPALRKDAAVGGLPQLVVQDDNNNNLVMHAAVAQQRQLLQGDSEVPVAEPVREDAGAAANQDEGAGQPDEKRDAEPEEVREGDLPAAPLEVDNAEEGEAPAEEAPAREAADEEGAPAEAAEAAQGEKGELQPEAEPQPAPAGKEAENPAGDGDEAIPADRAAGAAGAGGEAGDDNTDEGEEGDKKDADAAVIVREEVAEGEEKRDSAEEEHQVKFKSRQEMAYNTVTPKTVQGGTAGDQAAPGEDPKTSGKESTNKERRLTSDKSAARET